MAAALCVSALATAASAQMPPPMEGGDLRAVTDRIVGASVAAFDTPRTIVGISWHHRRFYFPYGGPGQPPLTRDSIVEIGSITKVFTTTLLADAIERGVIDPGQSIQAYLPAVPLKPCTARITPIELADFSSGLAREPDDLPRNLQQRSIQNYTERDFLHWLSGAVPRTGCNLPAPYLYSNASVGLLGPILRNATGRPWQALIAEAITRPLGMVDTAVAPERAAQVQGFGANGQPAPRWPVFAWYAAGALRSTAQDMLSFGEAALGHDMVNGRPLPPMLRQAFRSAMRPRYQQGNGIGLSWESQGDGSGGTMTFKNGGTAGFSSVIVVDPSKDCAVFIVGNKQNLDMTRYGTQLMRAIGR